MYSKTLIKLNFPIECIIYAVGKPVFFKSADQLHGSWLRDSATTSDSSSEKIWMTKEDEPYHLYEYANKVAYRTNTITKVFRLKLPFQVSFHNNRIKIDPIPADRTE